MLLSGKAWIKAISIGIAAIALFVGGYRYAAALYQADIADLKRQHALATKELTDEYRKKEQSQAKQVADAWDGYEKARAESVDLRDDVERVRKLADDYRARLSKSDADTCKPCRERLGRCASLLEEGVGLGAEGADLSQRVATKKDAVVKVYSGQ